MGAVRGRVGCHEEVWADVGVDEGDEREDGGEDRERLGEREGERCAVEVDDAGSRVSIMDAVGVLYGQRWTEEASMTYAATAKSRALI